MNPSALTPNFRTPNSTMNSTLHRTCHTTTHRTTHVATFATTDLRASRAVRKNTSAVNLRQTGVSKCGNRVWQKGWAIVVVLLFATPVFAQREAKIPDPDPEIERKTFQVTEGFEVNLFAADPLLAKPISMNFDARGRLWVASSETYPQIAPGAKADDKIIILEDTKGVGRADKTSIFARGLLIPTGIEPGDGGVYVANSTELLHIEETKDGKAGKTRVLLSGFGTEDTHHILHTLRWGPDGLLYMNQSIYIHSHIETPHGPRHLNAGGIWAYRPETQQLEIFARGWINSWGHTWDRYGQSFVTDGAGGEGINWVVPGGYYPTAIGPHAARSLHGLNPGHPKYCGAEIVSGRHLPDDWQGNIITNDFRGNRVVRFALKEDGAGFASIQMPDVIRSTHPAFRPIDVKMGPDGAIYIADWYNPIIQHGEVDFRDPRRDHTHGRIWRITAKGRPLVERPKLVGATVEELLEQLKSPEQWTRHFAKRVLKERGEAKIENALFTWTAMEQANRDPRLDPAALEAMWVWQALGVPHTGLLVRVLESKDPRIRAAGVRAAGDLAPGVLAVRAQSLIADEHPLVRLETVHALARSSLVSQAQTVLAALEKPVDQWLDYALWLSMRELEQQWMPALKRGEMPFRDVKQLIFALKSVDAGGAAPTIVSLLKSGKVKKEQEADLLALLAEAGGPNELAVVLDRAIADEAARPRLLAALDGAARKRKVKPAGDLSRLRAVFNSKDVAALIPAARLTGAWRETRLLEALVDLMESGVPVAVKQAAMMAVAEFGGQPAAILLGDAAQKAKSPQLKRAAIVALAGVDADIGAKLAAEFLAQPAALDETGEVIGAFVQRKGGAEVLAKALDGKKVPPDIAKVALRTMRASGKETQTLTAALNKAGGLTEQRHILTAAEMTRMVADVAKLGDAARGEAVYRRKDMACQKCHAIAGAGGLVGPDLLSIGASAQVDYLIDSLLLPNKQVKEGYNSLRIETKGGKQVSGVKVRETPKELTLRDGEDREVVIQKDDIDTKADGGSLMPEGLIDPLTRGELLDLTRFLSELGKVGSPYAVTPARVIRRWQALEATPDAYTGAIRVGIHYPATANDPKLQWSSVYSTVAGVLPPDAAPRLEIKHGLENSHELVSYLRGQVEVTTPGAVRIKINGVTALSLWLDGVAVPMKEQLDLDLKPGVHTLTFAADWSRRPEGLRVELLDVPGSAARAKVVGGK
jgi:putative heme-binding domain-containing protein